MQEMMIQIAGEAQPTTILDIQAAKALDIDINKIVLDLVRPLVREELTREQRKYFKNNDVNIICNDEKRLNTTG